MVIPSASARTMQDAPPMTPPAAPLPDAPPPPAAATASVPPPSSPAVPVSLPPKKSRLKSNLLDIISQEVAEESRIEVKIIALSNEVVAQLYRDFIVYLSETLQKSTAAQQLRLARAAFEAPNRIQIWCVSEINRVMVNTQKDVFFDFIKKETRQTDVQVSIDVDQNVVTAAPEAEKRRTKTDVFEDMVKRNPLLLELKKSLNLIIE